MNIGEAAERSGLPPKTIRYYEEIDLVIADRRENGYRDYSDVHIHKLSFLRRARGLGFSIPECRLLLSLYEDTDRSSSDVKALALSKVAEIDQKISELAGLRQTLKTLSDKCHGDDRPDCPILDDLSKAP
ncbi:MAG: Cu(I)-responsive transcriptional regulator [Alphaproteobacteria bacterium]|nr:MAG: Cu(I)-responsive transcriptional regulator [Alphaproteobacteria bacterium]